MPSQVSLSLLPEFDAGEGLSLAHVFSLSYTFTSGSSATSSGELQCKASSTRRLVGAAGGAQLLWGVDGEEAMETIVHKGAFWEVRHGALRLQLEWKSFNSTVRHEGQGRDGARGRGVKGSVCYSSRGVGSVTCAPSGVRGGGAQEIFRNWKSFPCHSIAPSYAPPPRHSHPLPILQTNCLIHTFLWR